MLVEEELDIVSVATYSPAHAEITIGCADHGVPVVYCEKPIATRLPDAEQMIRACEKADTLLVINHNRSFDRNYRRLCNYIADGKLGELTSVYLQWGGGRLGNVGTHALDATLMLTGTRIEAVSGTLDLAGKPDCRGPAFRDPGGWALMRLQDGGMVVVDAADYATSPFRIIVNGTKGRAIAGLFKMGFLLEYWDGRTETCPKPPTSPSGMDVAVSEIVDWLGSRKSLTYPAEQAVHTLEAILALHAPHALNGAWCPLPLSEEDRHREVKSG